MNPAVNQLMLAVSGSPAAFIFVKATLFLALGLSGASLARRRRAALRHALLAAAFGMLLLLPVASLLAPPIRLVVPGTAKIQVVPAFPGIVTPMSSMQHSRFAVAAPPPRLSLATVLLAGWIAGLILFLAPVAIGLWRVRSLWRSAQSWPQGEDLARRQAIHSGIHRPVAVLLHKDLSGPMTCGLLYPAIVLPVEAEGWDADDLNRAIVHELEHVLRGDWLSQCLARAVCALYWFHPLVWMAWRQLMLEAERSCDDAVLGLSDATAYADQLVGLARRLSSEGQSPLLAMVSHSDLSTRVRAVLDSRQQRGRAGAFPVALACTIAAALVLTLSPFRMVAAPAVQPLTEAAAPQPADPAPPQNPSPSGQTAPVAQFVSSSQLVMVSVTVTDLTGKSIDGLGARDFVLTEDGVTQSISVFEFRKVSDPPEGTPASYYLLGFYSTNPKQDGQYRKIQVIDKNDSSAKLEYRSGYYPNKLQSNARPGMADPAPAAKLPAGTAPPVLIRKREPDYSEEARKAKYQGSAILSVEVSETGKVTSVSVVRSLGLGLDEKAIEAVKQWVFRPGQVGGTPTTMRTQVTVEFRLL